MEEQNPPNSQQREAWCKNLLLLVHLTKFPLGACVLHDSKCQEGAVAPVFVSINLLG